MKDISELDHIVTELAHRVIHTSETAEFNMGLHKRISMALYSMFYDGIAFQKQKESDSECTNIGHYYVKKNGKYVCTACEKILT